MLLSLKMLIGISNYWHLTNDQVTIGDPLLQSPILGRVVFSNRRSQHCDGVPTRFNRGRVCGRVDAARKPGHHSEFVTDEIFCKERGSLNSRIAGLPRSYNRNAASIDEVPKPLKVKQLDGVFSVP